MLIALAQAQSASPQGGILTLVLPFLLLGGVMYFLMIRPQQKRMRAQKQMWSELTVGEEVLTIGGIFGTIKHVDDDEDEIILEVAPGTTVRIVKNAIARRVSAQDHEDDLPEAWLEDDDDALEDDAAGDDEDEDESKGAGTES
ncbi:MAG: preprotein translocase subunit YajC [Actinomycetota bacterium]